MTLTAEQLAARKLGGSDMAALMGLGNKTPLDVYLEKVGEAEPEPESEAMELGTQFEEGVAQLYARRVGVKVRRDSRTLVHPEHDWATAHIDRKIVGAKKGLEIKASSVSGWGDEDTDQIPEHMVPQVMHYMAVTGFQVWDVGALLWGGYGPATFRVYTVPRDDELIDYQLEVGRKFWHEHVLAKEPPDPSSNQECARRWPHNNPDNAVKLNPELRALVADLLSVKADQKALAERRDLVEYAIKTAMGDATAVMDEQGKAYATWKTQTSDRFDTKWFKESDPGLYDSYVKPVESRVFRLTKHAKELKGGKDDD